MPYGTRRQVAVKLIQIPGLLYAFYTDVADTTSTALGHINVLNADGSYKPGVVFGINSPKPPKASKNFGTGTKRSETSFISPDKIGTARTDGWKITPGKTARAKSTTFSKLVYVEYKILDEVKDEGGNVTSPIAAIKYCWRMPGYQYAKLLATDKEALGIKDADPSEIHTLVMGANNPKPNRANKTTTSTDGKTQSITTFVSSAKQDNLSANWVLA